MQSISVLTGATPTLIVAANSWNGVCDIYNDSDTDMRICYDGSNPAGLVATPGAEVGFKLAAGGIFSLAQMCVPQLSKAVYALHNAGVSKTVQVQKW
jgi:hypothetical protein